MQDAYPGVLDEHATTLYTPNLAEIWKSYA